MKKSLLALAVLGAVAVSANAQNVSVYGVVDTGFTRTDTNNGGARWGVDSGIQSGSRLGFRGTEDLGGGLTAFFTLENGFNVDDGRMAAGNTLFDRQAFVGLKGSFGAVKLGHQETPMRVAHSLVDPFGIGLDGNLQNVFSQHGGRMSDTLNYSYSNGGLFGEVAYGFGESAGKLKTNRQLGLNVGYNAGPLSTVLAYHDSEVNGVNTVFVGGTYDFKVVKAHAAFAENEGKNGGTTFLKERDLMVGVSAPLGSGSVLASYSKLDDRAVGGNGDAQQYAIGYTHDLSKRTNLYTSFAKYDSKPAGSTDTTSLSLGVRHKF